MICNRLKKAINYLVAESQSAFVEGISMMHNILICHDLLSHYNRKNLPRFLLKIDLRKAYDMVSWEFLDEALERFGFLRKFRHLIMACVSSTKFLVKINGESHSFFEGRRGLRQGDPMSPLLFVLVIEYLSRILKIASRLPNLGYYPMCKPIKLTHIIFADDLMLFCKGNVSSVNRLMEVLNHFSAIANMDKSSIYLAGIDDNTKE